MHSSSLLTSHVPKNDPDRGYDWSSWLFQMYKATKNILTSKKFLELMMLSLVATSGRALRKFEPRDADISYSPDGPPIPFANGTNVDLACSRIVNTGLALYQVDNNIHVQPFNTTDPNIWESKTVFAGSGFQGIDLSNGGFAVAYGHSDNYCHIKIFDPYGVEITDLALPYGIFDYTERPELASYPGYFFVEMCGGPDHPRKGYRVKNDGTVVDDCAVECLFIDDNNLVNHFRGAISVSGNSVVDVYDNDGTSLSCKFVRTTDAYVSQEYSVLSDASITAVNCQSVAFGKSDEFVVASAVTESGLPKVYVRFGHTTSDFFTECTLSNLRAIPDIYAGPVEITYIGQDRGDLSLYDIVGRDLTGNLVGVRCWYSNDTNMPDFSPAETIAENIQRSSTVVTRLGQLLRGLWTTANEIFIQPFTCEPVPCAATPNDTASYPSEASSSSAQSSSNNGVSSDSASLASTSPSGSTDSSSFSDDSSQTIGDSSTSVGSGATSESTSSTTTSGSSVSASENPSSSYDLISSNLRLSSNSSASGSNNIPIIAALVSVGAGLIGSGIAAGLYYLRKFWLSSSRKEYPLAERLRYELGLEIKDFQSTDGQKYIKTVDEIIECLQDDRGIDVSKLDREQINTLASELAKVISHKVIKGNSNMSDYLSNVGGLVGEIINESNFSFLENVEEQGAVSLQNI
ncbi:MAG: hypothetical protein AMJ43_00705 [Coxiella sp. DG_40]|nr:MAG: hypothetical protein AMJ43_00705 [Coxiella sp. DG_40]